MPLEQVSTEHIFPLALGGSDEFTTLVHKAENQRLNAEIDSPLAASLFSAVARKRADARGHSGKEIRTPTVAASLKQTGQRLQLFFRPDETLGLWDPRLGTEITSERLLAEGLKLEYSENRFLRLRFTAKVVLGAGQRLFGESFASSHLQAELRLLANLTEGRGLEGRPPLKTKVWAWPFPPEAADEKTTALLGALAGDTQDSLLAVITRFAEGHFLFAVGVLGELAGCLFSPAEALELTSTRPEDLGLIYSFPQGRLRVRTVRGALEGLNASLSTAPREA